MGFLQSKAGRAGRGVREFLENLRAERVDSIRLTSASTDEPDDDDEDTRPEPKKPIVAKPKRKARAKKKSKAKKTQAAESPELIAATIARDLAKARATGAGTHTAGMSEPTTPRLRMTGQHFAATARPEEFMLAGMGYQNREEFDAHQRMAEHVKAQAQAHPSTPQERHLSDLNIPHQSSPQSVAVLRDSVKAAALAGKPRELPPQMFRSFRTERNSGPFDGGSGAAA
jgi:hypothetical protein